MSAHLIGVGNTIERSERRRASQLWLVSSLITLYFDGVRG